MTRLLAAARGRRARWLLAQCCGILIVTASAYPRAEETLLTIRITSPLGRTGMHGPIRLVAQVKHAPETHSPVKFFVDGRLQGEAIGGPPFAVEWVDENPYEPREIAAEICDAKGECARDVVKLEPMTIMEEAEVSSVLVEAAVQDATGKSINGLTPDSFALLEDDIPQTLDLVRSDVVDSTYILLVDSSQSMARRLEFVQQAAGRLLGHLPARDRVIVAPFSRKVEAVTGPTNDRATAIEAIGAIRSHGGTAMQ
jgi:hypothetical protein